MRTRETVAMEVAMNRAFEKSGMSLKEFIAYLAKTRDIFDLEEREDYVSFHVVKEGKIYQFFFVFDAWYCKQ